MKKAWLSILVLIAFTIIAISAAYCPSSVSAKGSLSNSSMYSDTAQSDLQTVPQPPAPPVGFNPLTASDSDLAKYGFPNRPSDPTALKEWNNVMAHSKTYIPIGAPIRVNATLFATTIKTNNSGNWCGYSVDPQDNAIGGVQPRTYGTGGYSQTCMTMIVPTTSPTTGLASFWTGLGGDCIQPQFKVPALIQGGIMMGTNAPNYINKSLTSKPFLFTEDYWESNGQHSSTAAATCYNWPYINFGDKLNFYIMPESTTEGPGALFYIDDQTNGKYTSVVFLTTFTPLLNASVEWVYESPLGVPACSSWGSTTIQNCGFYLQYGTGSWQYKFLTDVNNIALNFANGKATVSAITGSGATASFTVTSH